MFYVDVEDILRALDWFEIEHEQEAEFLYCNRATMRQMVFALREYVQKQEWGFQDPFDTPRYKIFNTEIVVDQSLEDWRFRLESREIQYTCVRLTQNTTFGGAQQIYQHLGDRIKSEFDLYELRNCKFLNPISSDALNELLFGTEGGTHDKAND